MGKIILSERQFNLLAKTLMNEAVSVPEKILDSGRKLYDIVLEKLKTIKQKENQYTFKIKNADIEIGDTIFNKLNINVEVSEVDWYDGPLEIASMGMGNEFKFDEGVMMQLNIKDNLIDLHLNFIAGNEWEPHEMVNILTKDETHQVSIMAHELMHRYTRHKKPHELIGGTADYQAYSSGGLSFGVPVLNKLMRYSYFIQTAENLVRPAEIASRMTQKGITREQFYDFIVNDPTYIELKEIRDFSFEYLISQLKEEMDYVDVLLEHAQLNIEGMSEDEKIKEVLELVYINLVNAKVEAFDKFFFTAEEMIYNMFGPLARLIGKGKEPSEGKEKVRKKYINYVAKYSNRSIDFFKDECERFNYESTNLMKRISKIYSLILDEKEQTNESILNWDLHQELMEKKYGKRKIQTKYTFKR